MERMVYRGVTSVTLTTWKSGCASAGLNCHSTRWPKPSRPSQSASKRAWPAGVPASSTGFCDAQWCNGGAQLCSVHLCTCRFIEMMKLYTSFAFGNFVSPTISTAFASQPLAAAIGVTAKSCCAHWTANCQRFQIRCLSLPYNNPIVSYNTWKLGVTLSREHPVYAYIHSLCN